MRRERANHAADRASSRSETPPPTSTSPAAAGRHPNAAGPPAGASAAPGSAPRTAQPSAESCDGGGRNSSVPLAPRTRMWQSVPGPTTIGPAAITACSSRTGPQPGAGRWAALERQRRRGRQRVRRRRHAPDRPAAQRKGPVRRQGGQVSVLLDRPALPGPQNRRGHRRQGDAERQIGPQRPLRRPAQRQPIPGVQQHGPEGVHPGDQRGCGHGGPWERDGNAMLAATAGSAIGANPNAPCGRG